MTDHLGLSVCPEHVSQSGGRHHVVMFSGGVASWAMAKWIAQEHGTAGLTLLFADTKMEDEDTYRFLDAAARNVGGTFVRLEDGRDIWQVFRDVKFLGNTRIDPCSRVLKRELMRKWVDANCDPANTTVYVGIEWSEAHRAERYARYWHPYEVDCPLIKTQMTKAMMHDWAAACGLPKQRLYEMGFAHANCGGGCVKAGQAQFELLLRKLPERYAWWEENEEAIRRELGKDITILRDRRILNGREVVKPITLREFRERLEAQPSLFDEDEWGGCACTEPMDDELRKGSLVSRSVSRDFSESAPRDLAQLEALMAERDRLRRFAEWVVAHKLVRGVYADDDHPYDEWVTPEGDEMDFVQIHERAREALNA